MDSYSEIIKITDTTFKRHTGLSKSLFNKLVQSIGEHILDKKKMKPIKNKGISSEISLDDQVLL